MKRVKNKKAKSSIHQAELQSNSVVSMTSMDQYPFGSTLHTPLSGASFNNLLRGRKSTERTTPMQVKIMKLDLKSIIKKKKKSSTQKTKKRRM